MGSLLPGAAACPALADWYQQAGHASAAASPFPAVGSDAKLEASLVAMAKADQAARAAAIAATTIHGPVNSMAVRHVMDIDQGNLIILRRIIAADGVPTEERVGRDGIAALWLLIQHASSDVRLQARVLTAISGKNSGISSQQIALLTDRVRVEQGELQVYGSQFHFAGKNFVPYPIEDEAHVDQRRMEAGLPPLAEYACSLRAIYKIAPSN